MTHEEQASVIYNPDAGGARSVAVEDVERCLRAQGFGIEVHVTEGKSDLDDILPDAQGIVVVCGGDGTLAAVLERVAGRDDVSIAHLPLGTANNLGYTLGLPAASLEAIADLASRPRRKMDFGHVSQGGRSARFLEGFGCGLYAELLHAYDPDEGKSVARALKTLMDVLPSFESVRIEASVDGRDASGEYLLFAVLNTKRIGPQIELAPDADPCDGHFEVVAVEPDDRGALASYVEARVAGSVYELENIGVQRGRDIEIAPDDFTFHLDLDTFETATTDDHNPIRVGMDAGAAEIIVPD